MVTFKSDFIKDLENIAATCCHADSWFESHYTNDVVRVAMGVRSG